ncbi:MAG TPA: PKD domain-containing protein [Candidatus Nanoarchaeia archaeon]|nr:PKD domain-containing protein [Candidatus Nanoarchaeia archaeon]
MKKWVLFFVIFILIGNVSASFSIGNKSNEISTVYGPSENIKGWINLSLVNEPASSLFEDSRGNSVTLIDLLKSDFQLLKPRDYSCNPVDCGIGYTASNGQTSKTFNLPAGKSKILGFKFLGELGDFEWVNFDIESNAGDSCTNQIKIDFFADGTIDLGNNKSGTGNCDYLRENGCYNSSIASNSFPYIAKGPDKKHCQRITLTESPGFELGAWMNLTADSGDITFAIYDVENSGLDEELASCEVPKTESGAKEFSCPVNFLITDSKEYYICIYSDKQDENSKIRGYGPTTGCGFYDNGGGVSSETFAYNIFAIGKEFGSVGTFQIRDNLPNDDNKISDKFEDKIANITGNTNNCTSSNSCIIPIRIISGINQDITIKDISIKYEYSGGSTSENKVYDVNISSAVVNSNGSIRIALDNSNLTVPSQHSGFLYSLKLEGREIFKKSISVQAVPQVTALTPMSTVTKFPTNFIAFISSVGNNSSIVEYVWEINGVEYPTQSNRLTYTFNDVRIYPIKLTITDTIGRSSSRTFLVNVDSYISVLSSRINESRTNIDNIQRQIANLSDFEKQAISQVINTSKLNSGLQSVQSLYIQSKYEEAADALISLNIPKSIEKGISTDLVSFYPTKSNVDVDVVKAFQGGTYQASEESAYMDSIISWHISNINTKIKYSQFDSVYDNNERENIINVVELKAIIVNSLNYSAFFYIRELDDLRFQTNYNNTSNSGYIQIPIDSQEKIIKFSTTEELNFLNLPIFLSPALSNLVIIGDISPLEEQGIKWALFILILFFLIIVGVIVYIVLQQWYKTKYETYLFKNRNYLYNLIHYIQNSKKGGMSDNEMIKKLKKSGWNSEQINYVMKKYAGERTGMWEIPVDKLLDRFRKNKVITPLQQSPAIITPRAVAPALNRPIVPRRIMFQPQKNTATTGQQPKQPNNKSFFQKY